MAFSPEDISSKLFIARKTVHNHLLNIRTKLNIHTTIEITTNNIKYEDIQNSTLKFTERGKKVFALHLSGIPDWKIGEMLGMSYSGVRRHKEKMLNANACKSMRELVLRYLQASAQIEGEAHGN